MADRHVPAIGDILNPQETEALRFAQNLYGGQAKLAAANLAAAAQLDEPARDQFIGGVVMKLEGLDFEQRRTVYLRLGEAAAILNDTVFDGSLSSGPQDLVELALQNGSTGSIYDSPTPAIGADHSSAESNRTLPLLKRQRTWLSRIFNPAGVDTIEALPTGERLVFATRLGQSYQELVFIGSGSPENRRNRAHQLVAFMGGQSPQEIAEQFGSTGPAIILGLKNMAKTIAGRMSIEEITALVPTREPVPDAAAADRRQDGGFDSETAPKLSVTQKNWFEKFAGEEDVRVIEGLTSVQSEYFADRLSAYLRPFTLRRDGPVKTERRVAQMSGLITGKTLEEIAEATHHHVEGVKYDLHSTAGILERRLAARDLGRLLREATSLGIEQVDD